MFPLKSGNVSSAAAAPPEVSPSAGSPDVPSKVVKTPSGSSNGKNKKKKRNSLGSRTYADIVHEAISSLKGRNGSSVPAIHKWIISNHPDLECPQFKSRVMQGIRSGTKSGRFVKVKASYKISPNHKTSAKKKTPPAKSLTQVKAMNAKKLAELEKSLSPEAFSKAKKSFARKEASAKKKLKAEQFAKERAERLKRRRLPMEDTKLHEEDALFCVKPPADLLSRPYLPYFWNMTAPLDNPSRDGKTSSQVLTASKVDGLDSGNFGLVPDLLQVYHFFRGDVSFKIPGHRDLVPNFSLSNLVFATEQILNGNAKRARCLPPLLVHLFCVSLQILCRKPDIEEKTPADQLQKDLHNFLEPALTPASWSDVLLLYIDAMERYHATDASLDPNVLPPLKSDLAYLFELSDEPSLPMTPATASKKKDDASMAPPLPEGYYAYLGDPNGMLPKAYTKLLRQDPWLLTAEEVMVLLRALTDDILATHPAISQDMANRDEAMQNLAKTKRAADANLRKVRLAFEGPKKTASSKKVDNDSKDVPQKAKEEFKPSATRKQFDAAIKAQQKAADAYEKGMRDLTARTEPIGYDRDFNAVYCFRHDPDVLYVEDVRSPSNVSSHMPSEMRTKRRSWHVIETTSLFELYIGSLDIRGRREHNLYEGLVGPAGSKQSLRRFLYDNVAEAAEIVSRQKQLEDLKDQRRSATEQCRRSGRLADTAAEELNSLEHKIEQLERRIEAAKETDESRDYSDLTGLTALCKFEKATSRESRRSREVREQAYSSMPLLSCSKLTPTGMLDGSGLMGIIVADMLEVEELCENLSPWERSDLTRERWVSSVEGSVHTWNSVSPVVLGPVDAKGKPALPTPSSPGNDLPNGRQKSAEYTAISTPTLANRNSTKRLKIATTPMSPSSFHSAQNIVSLVRQPLIDLEARVAAITNLDIAAQDVLLADENMSVDGSEGDDADQEAKIIQGQAWKRQISRLEDTPTQRSAKIRELLVSAISDARKAHQPDVVGELRAALLMFHPGAANQCKIAALEVLERHGGYDGPDDEEFEEEAAVADEEGVPSVVSAEASILGSSLAGSEDSSRHDWILAVKSCKTISRLGSLVASFCTRAREKLEKLEGERDDLLVSIDKWEKIEERKKAKGKKRPNGKKERSYPSEVWANVSFTSELCMAKADDEPFWPARRCLPKDPGLSQSLKRVKRSLVALVGEMGGLRVCKDEDILPFTGEMVDSEDDLASLSTSTREQLTDCLTMARRISRGLEKAK